MFDAFVGGLDAFVGGLDVKGLGFERSVPAVMGRLPYNPRNLLKLYLYGYLNEVRSSRRLDGIDRERISELWRLRRFAVNPWSKG